MANIFHVERTANKITLGTTGTTINVASHTASQSLALDASKNLESIDLSSIYQPLDAGLTSLAGLTYTSDSFIKVTATDTYAIRTIAETKTDLSLNLVENTALSTWAGSGNITTVGTLGSGVIGVGFTEIATTYTAAKCTDATADNTAGNQTSHADVVVDGDFTSNGILNRTGAGAYSILAFGTDVQAYHANLAAIAGGTWTGANSITTLGTIGTGTWAATDVAVLHGGTGASTAANARTNLGLGTTNTLQFAGLGIGIVAPSDGLVEIRDDTIDTAISYTHLYSIGIKTAGATDHNSTFSGFKSFIYYDQSGGELGYCKGGDVKFTHTDGNIGDASNSRYVIGLQLTTTLNGGKLYGYTQAGWFAVSQGESHEITGNVYGNYIHVNLNGTVGGTAYMLYLEEATGLDYGIYQNGTAMNVLGGPLMVALKTGTDQANAGATAGELYVDTNDDNTVKMGV